MGFLATGLGLLFGAANVYFRDSENIVDMLLMVATWASPVMYSWTMVEQSWDPAASPSTRQTPSRSASSCSTMPSGTPQLTVPHAMPPNLFSLWLPVGLVISLVVLALGQLTFRRLEGRFAQEL